eukprot:2546646-Amphidinium_carterae.1
MVPSSQQTQRTMLDDLNTQDLSATTRRWHLQASLADIHVKRSNHHKITITIHISAEVTHSNEVKPFTAWRRYFVPRNSWTHRNDSFPSQLGKFIDLKRHGRWLGPPVPELWCKPAHTPTKLAMRQQIPAIQGTLRASPEQSAVAIFPKTYNP